MIIIILMIIMIITLLIIIMIITMISFDIAHFSIHAKMRITISWSMIRCEINIHGESADQDTFPQNVRIGSIKLIILENIFHYS